MRSAYSSRMTPRLASFHHWLPYGLSVLLILAAVGRVIFIGDWWGPIALLPLISMFLMVRRYEENAFISGWHAATMHLDLIIEDHVPPQLREMTSGQMMIERPTRREHQRAMMKMLKELAEAGEDDPQAVVRIVRKYR